MDLVVRDPNAWYLDTHLWIPKKSMLRTHVDSLLTYTKGPEETIKAWEEEIYHYRVPRNFMRPEALNRIQDPLIDSRWQRFPTYKFQSRVQLDRMEPTKTYQTDGARALLNTYDGILCLRCGAGKTVTSLHAASQLNQPILVIVNDKGLARQWADSAKMALGLEEEDIGRVGGDGQRFDWKKPLTIALVQTLASRAADNSLPAEMVQHFGVILCDEAHTLGAPYFNLAIPPFPGRRWGLSATPKREDGFDSLLEYTLGRVVYTYLRPNLSPTFIFRRTDVVLDVSNKAVKDATHTGAGKFHHGRTYGWFARDRPDRTDMIAADIRECLAKGRQVLVLTHSREMTEILAERFENAGTCHSGVPEAERIYRINNCNPVIAVMQLGKQALDKPSLDTLMLCEPTTKKGVLQQVMGRILRTYDGKRKPLVFVYEDRYIKELSGMCQKIRQRLRTWPEAMGGQIPYKIS